MLEGLLGAQCVHGASMRTLMWGSRGVGVGAGEIERSGWGRLMYKIWSPSYYYIHLISDPQVFSIKTSILSIQWSNSFGCVQTQASSDYQEGLWLNQMDHQVGPTI